MLVLISKAILLEHLLTTLLHLFYESIDAGQLLIGLFLVDGVQGSIAHPLEIVEARSLDSHHWFVWAFALILYFGRIVVVEQRFRVESHCHAGLLHCREVLFGLFFYDHAEVLILGVWEVCDVGFFPRWHPRSWILNQCLPVHICKERMLFQLLDTFLGT